MERKSSLAPFVSYEDLAPSPVFAFNSEGAFSNRLWSTAYRQRSVFSAIADTINDSWQGQYEEDPDYDPFLDPQLKDRKGIMHKFLTSGSREETYRRLNKFDSDMEDLALLDMSPNSGVAEAFFTLADPSILAPLAPAKVLRMSSKTERFMYGGAFSAAIMAPTEIIKQSQLEGHTLGHTAVALGAATILGGGLTAAFGRPAAPIATHADKQIYRSAGANVSPEKAREAAYANMEGDALAETGIGVEKLPWNPVIRMTQSPNPFVRGLADRMVDMGGMMQKKVREGDNMNQSVETNFRTTYLGPLVDALRASDEAYLGYRGKVAKDGDVARSFQMIGAAITRPKNMLNEAEFRIRVGKGLKNGDVDEAVDAATPFVNKAITAYRKQFDHVKTQAESVDLFRRQLNAKLVAAKNADNTEQVRVIEAAIVRLNKEGVTPNTAPSYLPRVYRVDKIMENEQGFLDIVSSWAAGYYRMTASEANSFAKSVMDEVTRSKPFVDLDEKALQFDWITAPSGVKARTLEIPDNLIVDFLENDAEVLLRHHTRTMGMDIEITRAFGDIDMRSVIEGVTSEYQKLIDDAVDVQKPISDRLFFNLKTGVSATLKVFRGSGGSGKVAFGKNVLGDGVYFGRNKKVASRYGSDVKEHVIHLKNPFVIKTDADLLKLFDDMGIDSTAIRNGVDEVKRLAASVNAFQKTKPPIDDFKKFVDDLDPKFQKAIKDLTELRRAALDKVEPYLKNQGHDGVVVSFKAPDFNQLTKGELTLSKLVKETNFDARGEYLLKQTFSHDQVYVFGKNIDEYENAVPKKDSLEKRRMLKKALEDDLRDIRGLRDRLRGTYGASKDPHAMSSRFVRVMKSFNVLVGMGGAVASSVPDVARIVMVEGMGNAYSKGLKHMFKSSSSTISKMQRKEMRAAAVSVDAVLGLRAAQFSDVGDLFGARFGFERKLNDSVGTFFMLNGLNYWNQVLKEWAGNTTSLLMSERIMKSWTSLSRTDQEKFLKNGISQQDHMRMQALIKANGQKVDGEWMPNTDLWNDPVMVRKYRNALNQNVERIIVTPGAGDRALWTSTEFGSLLTQFKSYGQGAMVRVLTAGLQEKDAAFWQGAFLMVGLASIVNEFKRYQYGIDKEQDFDEKLIDAIDRSGTLGWFTDVNNAIEKISDFNIGVRPAFTDETVNYMPDQAKAASVFGPTVNMFGNLGSVAGDVLTGNIDAQTGNNARFITPLSNIPYLDPAFDVIQNGIFGKQ